jgi:hypothetical protein
MKRISRVVVGACLGLALVLSWRYPHAARLQGAAVAFVVGALLAPLVGLLLRGRFRCPRCQTDLHMLSLQQYRRERRKQGWFRFYRQHFDGTRPMQLTWDRWSSCPRCGLSLDDPHP